MIIDKINHILFYEPLVPGLRAGAERLRKLEAAGAWMEGRYEFPGGYLMIQKGETKPLSEGTFEAHRNYIDVQIILEGCEEMAWQSLEDLTVVIPYQKEKDAERLDGSRENHMQISEGMFYIAFPDDGHKAVSHTEEKHRFTKAVMKLLVSEEKE